MCAAAVMSITVLIMSLVVERLWVVLPRSPYFDSASSLAVTSGLMLFGGLIAFTMVWVEFTVIAETSALTFMVAGTFKEFVTGVLLPSLHTATSAPLPASPLANAVSKWSLPEPHLRMSAANRAEKECTTP